jgi:crotonobetainyl-CoA:carnitine CoA-transferase CaiB-like acyl-CoA transferase
VIDFSHLMPGPWCTQVLGDLGADVIKVEHAGVGDPSRANPPFYRASSVYFHSVNRNKRSICLNLNDADDRAIAQDLLDRADVMVESYRPGIAQKLRIDYATVSATNPRVIYCSLNGFGATGALAVTPGHDAAVQGIAGLMHVAEGEVPPMPKVQTGDWAAAAYATIAILAAYIRRQSTGEGAFIETSMYDSLLSWSSIGLSSALSRLAGYSGEPALEAFGTNPRYATYATRDRKAVTVCLLEARSWLRFCDHIGRPDLAYAETAADRHTSHAGRAAVFREVITAFCLAHDRDELAARMEAMGIAIGPVYSPDEALDSAVAKARGSVGILDHPVDGHIPFFVDPLCRAGLSDPTRRHAPALGEHDAEIRAETHARQMSGKEDAGDGP